MNTSSTYDVAIIGAGMSGLAAGIRLAHFGQKVCIFERHNAVGGLNGFYSLGGRKYDVGLHAMTNYVRPGVKGTPLTKLLRQLRIDREEFALCEQKASRISFGPGGETNLTFTNDFAIFEAEVTRAFPAQIDGFRQLVTFIRGYDDVSLDAQPESARTVVRRHISDPLLEDMLFCPVMYYGSAQERDMEFGQFVIMFKALFFEGFARPLDGVRVILRVLLDKYRAAGGERRMKCGVQKIIHRHGQVDTLVLDSGEEVTAKHVISSIGSAETFAICGLGGPIGAEESSAKPELQHQPGRHSFVETITVLNRQPVDLGWGDDTIVFFNDSPQFDYACPTEQVDPRSGVICFPNNFDYGDGVNLAEGFFRVTCLANPKAWFGLEEASYQADKVRWFGEVQQSARRFLPKVVAGVADPGKHEGPGSTTPATGDPLQPFIVATDMFTPRTITKFTGHVNGAIYGAPNKVRDGKTALANLYLCGTDQGFLGIVGAMLSGISMANYHVLTKR